MASTPGPIRAPTPPPPPADFVPKMSPPEDQITLAPSDERLSIDGSGSTTSQRQPTPAYSNIASSGSGNSKPDQPRMQVPASVYEVKERERLRYLKQQLMNYHQLQYRHQAVLNVKRLFQVKANLYPFGSDFRHVQGEPEASSWAPPTPRPAFPAEQFRENLLKPPTCRSSASILPEWVDNRVLAPPAVSELLNGIFYRYQITADANCYWNALGAQIYGDPIHGTWLKAQHLAYFESVLSDVSHPRHRSYWVLARLMYQIPVVSDGKTVVHWLTLRQILHTPNLFPPHDLVQVTVDLFDIQLIRLVEDPNKNLSIISTGPTNRQQVLLYIDQKANHVDALYSDDFTYGVSWEHRIALPQLIPPRPDAVDKESIRRRMNNGQPFYDRVYPPLVPRPVIPEPTNDELSIVLGIEIIDRPHMPESGNHRIPKHRIPPPLGIYGIGNIPVNHGTPDDVLTKSMKLYAIFQGKRVAQLLAFGHKVGLRIRGGARKADIIRSLVEYLQSSQATATRDPIQLIRHMEREESREARAGENRTRERRGSA